MCTKSKNPSIDAPWSREERDGTLSPLSMRITPVILSGGSGTRLWPVSTAARPKQFHRLAGDNSLLQETALRAESLGMAPPVVVCSANDVEEVKIQLDLVGVEPSAVIAEPAGRNTGPAVAAATLVGEGVMLVMPADHVITDLEALSSALVGGAEAADKGHLVVFGVVPTRPETGYGYIEAAPSPGVWAPLVRFTEKPDPAKAEEFVRAGHLWNSGMFLFEKETALSELSRWAPEILDHVKRSLPNPQDGLYSLSRAFLKAPSIAFDRAVMEKTDRAAVVPLEAGWSDVGSWQAVWELLERDTDGNVIAGDPILLDVKDSLIRTGPNVVVVGLENVVVVEHDGRVLIASIAASQRVSDLPVHR